MPELFSRLNPGERAIVIGAAYWDNLKSSADSLRNHVLKSIIFSVGGPIGSTAGWGAGSHFHRMGLIAVTDSELVLIDLGSTSKELTTTELLGSIEKPSVKKYDLSKLKADCNSDNGILAIAGKLNILAIFPPSIGVNNAKKAFSIANAISRGHLRECPNCQATYNIEEYSSDAPAWKCPGCKTEAKKELL